MPPRLPQARGNGCRGATGLPSAQGEPYFPDRLTITHACRKLTENGGSSGSVSRPDIMWGNTRRGSEVEHRSAAHRAGTNREHLSRTFPQAIATNSASLGSLRYPARMKAPRNGRPSVEHDRNISVNWVTERRHVMQRHFVQ